MNNKPASSAKLLCLGIVAVLLLAAAVEMILVPRAPRFGVQADGGTTLARWQPGEILYDHAVFLARLGMRSGELAGILWHQGESDSDTEENARSYGERFEKMTPEERAVQVPDRNA